MTPLEGLLPERKDLRIIERGYGTLYDKMEAGWRGYNQALDDCLSKLEEAVREGRIKICEIG